jgi:hypothetical protein
MRSSKHRNGSVGIVTSKNRGVAADTDFLSHEYLGINLQFASILKSNNASQYMKKIYFGEITNLENNLDHREIHRDGRCPRAQISCLVVKPITST